MLKDQGLGWIPLLKAALYRTIVHPLAYHPASSVDDAARSLSAPDAYPLSGGTDLLVLMKERLVRPAVLVDLRRIPGWREIEPMPDGGLRIGAATRIADLAQHEGIRRDYPALAQSAESVGTPALRNMGTIGGNLCQRPRCWYFRRGIPCLKNGGTSCPAAHAEGENQYHAIFGGGPCYIVHPSDPAVALLALDAVVEVAGSAWRRQVPLADFFVLPADRMDKETILAPDEMVAAIVIPGTSAGARQRYDKLMQRGSWDFALVSLAAVRLRNGDVRLVLGGVAPRPWRVGSSIEEDVATGKLDDDDVATLADRALYDAAPLSRNGYKVDLAAALLRRGIRFLDRGGA